jgi:Kef-type K+ transport system membrane component KefB
MTETNIIMPSDPFIQLSVVLGIAFVVTLVLRLLRQPMIIGYIVAGLVLGPAFLDIVNEGSGFEFFSRLGVALLLFILGLGLNLRKIKDVLHASLLAGLGQILFTAIAGYVVALLLGFPVIVSIYLAIALTLSSTIIVLRILDQKGDQDQLYGRVTIGMLLIQDLFAMIVVIAIATSQQDGLGDPLKWFGWILLKIIGIAIAVAVFMKAQSWFPQIERFISRSTELLFLFGLAVAFVAATSFETLGLSSELGALLAGVVLSASPVHREMAVRLQPIRDFFLMLFFIFLGANISLESLFNSFPLILIFSLFVLVGNPLIVMLIMRSQGYTNRTSFFAGLSMAQISEFSIILLQMGVSAGHIPPALIGPLTMVGLLTIAGSSYLMVYNQFLYRMIVQRWLRHGGREEKKVFVGKGEVPQVILIGCGRLGSGILQFLKRKRYRLLVVDHDPSVIDLLGDQRIPAVLGAADDPLFLDELPLQNAKLIISTLSDVEDNVTIRQYLRHRRIHAVFVATANRHHHARTLYGHGVHYVITPYDLGRNHLLDLLKKNTLDPKKYRRDRLRHLKALESYF